MKINQIELKNHGPYKDKQIFQFDDGVNIIKGGCGSGKTILFNILRRGVVSDIPGVKVAFEGDVEDFKKNLNLIFIDNNEIIKNMDSTPATANLGLGDAVLMSLNRILLKRAETKKDLPLIIDADDISFLNQQHRTSLMDKIRSLKIQLILFEKDFKEN